MKRINMNVLVTGRYSTTLDCFQVVKARNGELSSWEELGCLKSNVAFIILIDQFCRNIYRVNMDLAFIGKWNKTFHSFILGWPPLWKFSPRFLKSESPTPPPLSSHRTLQKKKYCEQ